jgi:hypothetical protein
MQLASCDKVVNASHSGGPEFRCRSETGCPDRFLVSYLSSSTGRLAFDSQQGKISLLHSVLPGSGAHPIFYPVGTVGDFPGDKEAGECS